MLRTQRRSPARGFTLVELMVVMVIIAVLASLISVAVIKVMDNAKITRVRTEIESMHQAILSNYKIKDTLPPNVQDAARLARFWQSMFPYAQEQPPAGLTSAQALVFWLSGFSPDRNKPITGVGTRIPPFPFVVSRLHDPANPTDTVAPADPTQGQTGQWVNSAGKTVFPVYYPDHNEMTQPYVYFDVSRPGSTASYANTNSGNTLTPYKNDNGGAFMNAQSFQIVCAGTDNDHGTGGSVPTGVSGGDLDNVTNFARGLLVDEKP